MGNLPSHLLLWFLAIIYLDPGFEPIDLPALSPKVSSIIEGFIHCTLLRFYPLYLTKVLSIRPPRSPWVYTWHDAANLFWRIRNNKPKVLSIRPRFPMSVYPIRFHPLGHHRAGELLISQHRVPGFYPPGPWLYTRHDAANLFWLIVAPSTGSICPLIAAYTETGNFLAIRRVRETGGHWNPSNIIATLSYWGVLRGLSSGVVGGCWGVFLRGMFSAQFDR